MANAMTWQPSVEEKEHVQTRGILPTPLNGVCATQDAGGGGEGGGGGMLGGGLHEVQAPVLAKAQYCCQHCSPITKAESVLFAQEGCGFHEAQGIVQFPTRTHVKCVQSVTTRRAK